MYFHIPWVYARVAYLYGYMCEYIMGMYYFPSPLCVRLRVTAFWTRSCGPNSITGDSALCPLRTRYTGDSKTIHVIIRRSVSVRAMKTRRRFGSKTASFHVSACSCIIFLIYRCQYYIYVISIISCNFLRYFTIIIIVSVHESSVSVHLIYLVDLSIY